MKVISSEVNKKPSIFSRIYSFIKKLFKIEELSEEDKKRIKTLELESRHWNRYIQD
jgi:hypothetical protein